MYISIDQMKKKAKDDKAILFRNVNYLDVINRKSRLGEKDACTISLDAVKYCLQILESLGPLSTYDAISILLEQLGKEMYNCIF